MEIRLEKSITKPIEDFIKSYGFEIPTSNFYLVAYDDNDKVIGFASIQSINILEPFICINPIVANNLYQRAEMVAQMTSDRLFCLSSSEAVDKLLGKLGYEKLNNTLWRKKWG